MLMQHYERTGEFAKAEDALFAMLDAQPDNPAIVESASRSTNACGHKTTRR